MCNAQVGAEWGSVKTDGRPHVVDISPKLLAVVLPDGKTNRSKIHYTSILRHVKYLIVEAVDITSKGNQSDDDGG